MSIEFFHDLYLDLLNILDVIFCIKYLDTKPSSVLVGINEPGLFPIQEVLLLVLK